MDERRAMDFFGRYRNAKNSVHFEINPDQGWANFSHEGSRFGKTVETAGRTLIGKQGENLFSFFEDHGPRTNVISKIKDFHLVFHFNFAPLKLVFLKITAIRDL